MTKRTNFLGSDRIGVRIILLSALFLIWTGFVTVPKSNGLDLTLYNFIIGDYMSLFTVTSVIYIFRKLVIKKCTTPRLMTLGALFEIGAITLVNAGVGFFWKGPLVGTMTFSLMVVIILHASLVVWGLKESTRQSAILK